GSVARQRSRASGYEHTSGSSGGSDCEDAGEQERQAERTRELTSPGHVLLDRRHAAQREHRRHAAEANAEHHEHQAPAAADAEGSMADSNHQAFGLRDHAAPPVDEEAERTAALAQAAVTERAELPQPRRQQRGADDQLGMLLEPGRGVDGGMDSAIQEPR